VKDLASIPAPMRFTLTSLDKVKIESGMIDIINYLMKRWRKALKETG